LPLLSAAFTPSTPTLIFAADADIFSFRCHDFTPLRFHAVDFFELRRDCHFA
jgi:hypothetical protein